MEVFKSQILKYLAKNNYRPVRIKDIARGLGIPESSYDNFKTTVNKLVKKGVLIRSGAEIVSLASERKTIFLGDGANVYAQAITNGMKAEYVIAPIHLSQPRGICAARLVAQTASERGGVDPSQIRPRYLRKSNAELAKEKVLSPNSNSST